tara:strand:- start:35 stop:199 length:165 start_codon:yes stop_codon:yes gene_type:complete
MAGPSLYAYFIQKWKWKARYKQLFKTRDLKIYSNKNFLKFGLTVKELKWPLHQQ